MASVPTRRVRHGVKTVVVGCGNVSHRFLVVLAHRDLLLTKKDLGPILEGKGVFRSQ